MRTLLWIRYTLLILAFILALYRGNIHNYEWYTAAALLYLAAAQASDRLLPVSARWLGRAAELFACFWFAHTYAEFMYLLPFSFAVSLFASPPAAARDSDRTANFIGLAIGAAVFESFSSVYGTEGCIAIITLYACFIGLLFKVRRLSIANRETGFLFDEVRKKAYELEEAKQQAADFARKIENAAQLEERNRIAVELHDDLGHRLIRAKLMLEAAVNIHSAQPDKSFELMSAVKDQLQDSMETMRLTVRKWKPDRSAGHRQFSIHRLMEEAADRFGIEVTGDMRGMPYPLYPSAEVALFRNAQEAITNAIRHGGATTARITLEYLPDSVRMTVSNNGALPDQGKVDRLGLGITGMRERVSLLGGTAEIVVGDEFALVTTIPLPHNEDK
ncbi:sensor histidine kinase [Paenibacillus thermotolerans]|uniref:sensor histidine kinase n=1 Tax=Paenibacillus thermotolerans TaxID=3027807 RepID=UPI0023681C72|nr:MULTISPECIES: sensor histidine kinase [unclassified Paenibacillus]